MVVASGGYDLPAFEKLTTLKVWAEEGPPKGTLYHYPNPHNHQILSVAAQPAPPKIAVQIYTQAIHDQDGRSLHAGRSARKDLGLGRERDRRLHADLSASPSCCRPAPSPAAAGCLVRRGSGWSTRHCKRPRLSRQPRGAPGFRKALQRKSTIAFLMTLPLILLIALLVIYPALYSIHLATLNKSMERFVGFGNFTFLFKRETFWMVVQQSCIFAITAVIFKALIGFIVAHFVNNIPGKGQRKWRGMLLVPWVIPPAMSCLAWLWLFDPSYSAFNWILALFGVDPGAVDRRRQLGALLGHPGQRLDRRAVLHDHVSRGAQIGARAAL